jgi:hypothetical protein
VCCMLSWVEILEVEEGVSVNAQVSMTFGVVRGVEIGIRERVERYGFLMSMEYTYLCSMSVYHFDSVASC